MRTLKFLSLLTIAFLFVQCQEVTTPSGNGLIQQESSRSFGETYDSLKAIIQNNPNLSIMAEVDHQANAARAGLEMRPTRLLIFGNPNMGTPLMQAAPTTAIDLPQKMLVYENAEGRVFVAYNSPDYLLQRHGLEGQADILGKMEGALDKIANGAAR